MAKQRTKRGVTDGTFRKRNHFYDRILDRDHSVEHLLLLEDPEKEEALIGFYRPDGDNIGAYGDVLK